MLNSATDKSKIEACDSETFFENGTVIKFKLNELCKHELQTENTTSKLEAYNEEYQTI